MVAPAVEAPVVIGLDVGGTKILSGLVDRDGTARRARGAEPGRPEGVPRCPRRGGRGAARRPVVAIGYGIPANLERGTGRILYAMNLPLDDVDPCRGRTSASAARRRRERRQRGDAGRVAPRAGHAEPRDAHSEPGRWRRRGRRPPVRGWAELGHVVVREGGEECTCGGRGHLETCVGERRRPRRAGSSTVPTRTHTLVERAKAGDEPREALARIGASLGAAIASLVNIFDPELVWSAAVRCCCGRVRPRAGARRGARRGGRPARTMVHVVPAELGSEAGLVGAGLVAFEALDGIR